MAKSTLITLALLLGAWASAEEVGLRVLNGPLAVHSGPDASYGVLGTIEADQLYVGIAQQDGYWEIWFNRSKGWVHEDQVELATTDYDVVNAGTNVRSGPSSSYPKIGYAKSGSRWAVISTSSSGSYHQIFYEGVQAWFYAKNRATTLRYEAPNAPVSVFADEAVRVVAPQATVRTGPGAGYTELGTALAGQAYFASETFDGWRKIWFGPGEGWIADAEVDVESAQYDAVDWSYLNVRTGPGNEYEDVSTVTAGSRWVTAGYSGSWHQIHFAGATRWIYGGGVTTHDFLANPGDDPSPTSSSVGFMQLPASGPGFVRRCVVNNPDHAWGTPTLVNGLVAAADRWASDNPSYPRIRVGDMSLPDGGPFDSHVTHQDGTDVDIFLVRSDPLEDSVTVDDPSYSSARTREWLDAYLLPELPQIAAQGVLFSDPQLFSALTTVSSNSVCPGAGCPLDASGTHLPPGLEALPYVRCNPGHDDHMHVRTGSP